MNLRDIPAVTTPVGAATRLKTRPTAVRVRARSEGFPRRQAHKTTSPPHARSTHEADPQPIETDTQQQGQLKSGLLPRATQVIRAASEAWKTLSATCLRALSSPKRAKAERDRQSQKTRKLHDAQRRHANKPTSLERQDRLNAGHPNSGDLRQLSTAIEELS